jgi:colicin import membrane protein
MVIAIEATRQYTVPRYGRSAPALLLAILMHVLLGLFLFFGLNWQSHAPEVIQAEVWSALPQISAPAQTAPPPPPVVVEQPKPIDVVPPPPPPVQPEITIKEPVKKPPEKVAPPPPPPPPVQHKVEPKPAKLPPPPAPVTKPAVPSDLALLQQQAGTPSTGKAAQTSGPKGDASYGAKLQALIKQHIQFPAVGNPIVDLTIQILPGGVVGDVRVTQSSGNPAYDDAVIRGVHDASPLPPDVNGKVPNPLYMHFQYNPI